MWFLLEGEPLTSMQAPHPPTFALWVGLVLARWPPLLEESGSSRETWKCSPAPLLSSPSPRTPGASDNLEGQSPHPHALLLGALIANHALWWVSGIGDL